MHWLLKQAKSGKTGLPKFGCLHLRTHVRLTCILCLQWLVRASTSGCAASVIADAKLDGVTTAV